MDSDPEPRPDTRLAEPRAAAIPGLTSSETEEPPEEPPSSASSVAIVLGPLIALLTLVVPCLSVVADRSGDGAEPVPAARSDLVGDMPRPSRLRPTLP